MVDSLAIDYIILELIETLHRFETEDYHAVSFASNGNHEISIKCERLEDD